MQQESVHSEPENKMALLYDGAVAGKTTAYWLLKLDVDFSPHLVVATSEV